jgi:Tfp pilus assembly protein FimT
MGRKGDGSERSGVTRMNSHGYSIIELVVVIGVLSLTVALSAPYFLTYWQTSTLRAGAEELATLLNGARQLAIKENKTVCVTTGATRVAFHLTNCGAAAWVGGDSQSDGSFQLANAVQVTAATANATFTYLGGGGTGATYTVLNPASNQALCVVVAPPGRVSITAPATQPTCP